MPGKDEGKGGVIHSFLDSGDLSFAGRWGRLANQTATLHSCGS